ncbi:MAG TPA: Rv3235 family protein [Frankiaceae bacterium]|nr:Rv3235 family protein [Frankiaceae bacterium]
MTLAQLVAEPGAADSPARLQVSVHAIPDPDPPYDDEAADPPGAAPARERRRPLAPCPPMPATAALRLVPPEDLYDEEDDEKSFEPVRTSREELEDPVPRAAMLTRALLEAMAGIRPVSQLSKWVTADVLAVMQASVVHRAARPAPTALRRVLVSEPMPGIAEVTAIVDRGDRAEALALRLEGLDGRWVVTALQRA